MSEPISSIKYLAITCLFDRSYPHLLFMCKLHLLPNYHPLRHLHLHTTTHCNVDLWTTKTFRVTPRPQCYIWPLVLNGKCHICQSCALESFPIYQKYPSWRDNYKTTPNRGWAKLGWGWLHGHPLSSHGCGCVTTSSPLLGVIALPPLNMHDHPPLFFWDGHTTTLKRIDGGGRMLQLFFF